MIKDVSILVLAGGESRRFWPLPHKLTLQFGQNTTVLKYLLKQLQKLPVKQILVVTSAKTDLDLDERSIKLITQQGQGQGAAILSADNHLDQGPVLVLNADDVVEAKLFKTILKTADLDHNLIVGFKTHSYLPAGYLVLDGKKIASVHEKPGAGREPSDYVKLVCDFFVNGQKLIASLAKVKAKNPDTHYEETLSWMMQNGEQFELLEYSGRYLPLKYPWQTLEVMEYFLSQIKNSRIHKTAQIHQTASLSGPVILEKNARILENAKIQGPTIIGEGVVVGNQVLIRGSMIGENTVVGFSSEIVRSWVGADCWFHDNYIGDSVISNHCTFGSGAVLANLRFDENLIKSAVKGIYTNTGRQKLGAMVGVGVRIGVGALLMPGVKIGKNSIVGPGVVLNTDVEENRQLLIKQQLEITDNLLSNIHDRQKFRKQIVHK